VASVRTSGLGFVEAGLVGTLKLAGVAAPAALAATLLYRIVSFWLPLPAAGVAYALFRRREVRGGSRVAAAAPMLTAETQNLEVDEHVQS
jgi:uncharacterized membrane protein YbhN (UPF0104 family)